MHQQRMVAAPLPADPTPLRARPRRKPRRFRAGLRASPAPRSHSAAAGAGSQWDRTHPRPAHLGVAAATPRTHWKPSGSRRRCGVVAHCQAAQRTLGNEDWMKRADGLTVTAVCLFPGVDVNAIKVGRSVQHWPCTGRAASRASLVVGRVSAVRRLEGGRSLCVGRPSVRAGCI